MKNITKEFETIIESDNHKKKILTNLYIKWKNERDYPLHTNDGILNYRKWKESKPKVMFLLKESADFFVEIENKAHDIRKGNGKHFWWNICYWKYLIDELYKDEDPQFIKPEELPESKLNNFLLDSIAYVNIKKLNENKTNSIDSEIFKYAKKDKLFLKEQINLINPDIVFCNKITFKSYNHIFDHEITKENEVFHYHKNRIILNYYHPSFFQIKGGRKSLFYNLKSFLTSSENILKLTT